MKCLLNKEVFMNIGKYVTTVTFFLILGVGTSLGRSSSEAATAALPVTEGSETFGSLALPGLMPRATEAPFAGREIAWLQTGSFDSIALLLPSNGKKNKHNSQGEDEGNWDSRQNGPEHGGTKGAVSVQVVFGERDRQIIRDYCTGPSSNLPPGLAKRGGQLPPGLEKQLRRNGQLPPGLQKKVQPFPVELERRLPPLPTNYARVCIGGRGLIVDAQFNIVDIIDIFR
jgi:hypothetical protein